MTRAATRVREGRYRSVSAFDDALVVPAVGRISAARAARRVADAVAGVRPDTDRQDAISCGPPADEFSESGTPPYPYERA